MSTLSSALVQQLSFCPSKPHVTQGGYFNMRQYHWLVHSSTLTLTAFVGLNKYIWQTVLQVNSVFLQTVRCIFRVEDAIESFVGIVTFAGISIFPVTIITAMLYYHHHIIIMQLKLCLIACSICHPHHFHQNPPKTSLSPPPSSSSSLSTRSNW